MKNIKVGDKIEIVNAKATNGVYKNGGIFTVRHINPNGVYVQEHDWFIWPEEFIVLQTFQKGDKVRIIDKPWNHPTWQRLTRDAKKRHARHIGKEFEVATGNVLNLSGNKRIQVCHENTYDFLIGDFLEKVETKEKPQLTLEEKIKEAHRIIGEIVAGFKPNQTCLFNCIEEDRTIQVLYINNASTSISYKPYYHRISELRLHGYEVISKTAICAPNDEYVEVIGKMIALCRAVGRDLPEWV